MEKRVLISNINQFAGFVKKHPTLLNITSFGVIRHVFSDKALGGGCKCKKGANLAQFRSQFDAALAVLTPLEKTQLKNILNTEQVCYYKKEPNGQLKLICF